MSLIPIISFPQDICSLVPNGSGATGLLKSEEQILYATCQNLANDAITPNDVYNAFLNTVPQIETFVTSLGVPEFLYNTFIGYANRTIPYLYAVFIFVFILIIFFLMVTSKIDIFFGLWLIIGVVFIMSIIYIFQISNLRDYLKDQQSDFLSLFDSTFNTFKDNSVVTLASGYVAGSSMSINGPNGPLNSTGSTGPGIITLSDANLNSATPYHLFPYSTLSILAVPSTALVGSIYYVRLFEENPAIPVVPPFLNISQMIKPSYPKVIYITNFGSNTQNPTLGNGTINITNASSVSGLSVNNNYDQGSLFGSNTQTPPTITIAPGQCKGIMNVTYSNPYLIGTGGPTGTQFPNISLSASNWVEIS